MSAPYLTHGATLAFAWFLLINVVMCAAVVTVTSIATRRAASYGPHFWIVLRLMPAAAATLFVVALFVPSYWQFEPREAVEGFDLTLSLFAVVGAAIIAAAVVRGVAAWRSAAARVATWMRHATPMNVAGASLPAFAVDADQPVIALVGLFRPRMLLTRGLIDALTRPELEAAIAHELGHQRSFDNLKRLAMRAAPDMLPWIHSGRVVEQRWASAAEHAADRIGGRDDADARCALASALVKVARLTPSTVPGIEPISTLIGGGDIASRVRTLLSDTVDSPRRPRLLGCAALATCVAIVASYEPLLRVVHEATEIIVHAVS
jgi:hypothetical protein